MKYILIFIGLSCGLYAGNSTCSELVTNLEHGVRTIASGRTDDGMMEIASHLMNSIPPKERAERSQKFKDSLRQLSDFGAARRVTRISLLYMGEDCCRLRVLDRRNAGAVLWTFFGERDGDSWYVNSISMSANGDLGELMKESLDAADYAREEQKQP